jgi:hypothetical protein
MISKLGKFETRVETFNKLPLNVQVLSGSEMDE